MPLRRVENGCFKLADSRRSISYFAVLALLGLAACGPSKEERAATCIADYVRQGQAAVDAALRASMGASPAAVSLNINNAVLLADSDGDWSDCPEDFRTARADALNTLPAYKEGMEQLAQGLAEDMDALLAMRDALVEFRAAWVGFVNVTLTHLDNDAVTAQLDETEYAGLQSLLERQRDNED